MPIYSKEIPDTQIAVFGRGLQPYGSKLPGSVQSYWASFERAVKAAERARDDRRIADVVFLGRHSILLAGRRFPKESSEARAMFDLAKHVWPEIEWFAHLDDGSCTAYGSVIRAVGRGLLNPTKRTIAVTHADQEENVLSALALAMPNAPIEVLRADQDRGNSESLRPSLNDRLTDRIYRAAMIGARRGPEHIRSLTARDHIVQWPVRAAVEAGSLIGLDRAVVSLVSRPSSEK